MTASDASWLTAAMVGGTAITAVTFRLNPLVRSAGLRRTWLRCLIRSSSR
ncbi:hypothetical protein ABIC70_001107 [Methylobacterium sp. 1973]